ncbi:UNVERIFIED_CONTAM: hypothetical protein GTU68_048447 [Idotea baltica]|nr:hypothetical protein [Idotea baltica]
MCVEGEETNCGSRMLAGYRAPYTATFVQKLIDAGAVILGVTEMDEFGMGSSGEHSAFNCPRNPWDPDRTAGGSSSGAAVAVATRMVPIALGSDTGGSARQPAAFCGIYGLKPTYGRVSRYGLVAFGSSLDQVSPLAHTPGDLELLLEVLSGHDAFDSTSLPLPSFEPERPAEPQRLVGLRIGVLTAGPEMKVAPHVRSACERELARLEGFGAELVPIDLPHLTYAIPTYYIVAAAEASSNLARYDGTLFGNRARGDDGAPATRHAGFGDEVKRRILLGTYALSAGYAEAWYAKAQRVRTLLCRDFDTAFADVDVIACPTSPTVAFPLGSKREDALANVIARTR